ncbi:MAG: SUMF1/EgtB/PvdO family nonheme iron enzyme [Acidobacteriota bacterium]
MRTTPNQTARGGNRTSRALAAGLLTGTLLLVGSVSAWADEFVDSGNANIVMAPAATSCSATVPAAGQTGQSITFLGDATYTCDTPGAIVESDDIVGILRCISGGTFVQGSPTTETCRDSDEPQVTHRLTRPFAMMEREVTRWAWATLWSLQRTLPADPSDTGVSSDSYTPVQRVTWYQAVLFANLLSAQRGFRRCYYTDQAFTVPVDAGNYTAGTVYCDWDANGFRLPTEAEWEFSARANTGGAFSSPEPNYSGSTCADCTPDPALTRLNSVAWWCGNSDDATHNAGSLAQNGFNLYDVHGNVREWCWDMYGPYPSGMQFDYHGPSSGTNRVVRGGGWFSFARHCRSARRSSWQPADWNNTIGFRLVRSLNALYTWNFGDGSPFSTQKNPSHEYASAGMYNWYMHVSWGSTYSTCRSGTITITDSCIPPAIVVNPASQTISSGQTATLSVAAAGTSPAYRWYAYTTGGPSVLLADGPADAYTTAPLTATTSFWVRVYNSCGSVDSSIATITVTVGPTISSIKSKTGKPGSTATIRIAGHSSDKSKLKVYFGRKKVKSIKKVTSRSIQVTIPRLRPGLVQVYVISEGLESNRVDFQVK